MEISNLKYEIGIEGMTCSNCSNYVESKLRSLEGVLTANVNLITQKGLVSLKEDQRISNVKSYLESIGYRVTSVVEISKKDSKNRFMTLSINNSIPFTQPPSGENNVKTLTKILDDIKLIPGVVKIENRVIENENDSELIQNTQKLNNNEDGNKIRILYDPQIVKSQELYEEIKKLFIYNNNDENIINSENQNPNSISINTQQSSNYSIKYLNSFNENLLDINKFNFTLSKFNLIILIILICALLFLSMMNTSINTVLIKSYLIHPKVNLYIIIIISISIYIIYKFGLSIYKKSIKAYYSHKLVNMETLISLGSISAINLTILHLYNYIAFTPKGKDNFYYDANTGKINEQFSMSLMMVAHAAEAAATVLAITLIGKNVEERAKNNIRKYSVDLFNKFSMENSTIVTWMKPANKKFASLEEKKVDVGLLEKDDFVRLGENDSLLFDGVIVSGSVEVKENITFGYDVVSSKSVGDKIKSGSHVKTGSCVVMVEEVLEDCLLFKIIKEMSSSLNVKLKFQNFIDNLMRYFVPVIILFSFLTFVGWMIVYLFFNEKTQEDMSNNTDTHHGSNSNNSYLNLSFIFERSISILVISCPCAFGLAIPTVTTIALNLGLKYGILIKNASILPEVRNSNYFVFDKTGTLTQVVRELTIEYNFKNKIQNEKIEYNNKTNLEMYDPPLPNDFPILNIIAAIEKEQKHPIAEVIYAYCLRKLNHDTENNIQNNFSITKFIEIKSNGVAAEVIFDNNQFKFFIGNFDFISKFNIALNDELTHLYNELKNKNLNVCFIAVNNNIKLIMSIDSSSELRKEANFVVEYLQSILKREVLILSGDSEESVKEVGKRLNIKQTNCIGCADNIKKKEILNEIKYSNSSKNIQNFKLSGNNKVLMIGDGVNDILSLSEADYGISFNSNSQLNLISSDIIFVKEDLRLILSLIKLSKLTYNFIWVNIFWACIYNICMLPIASGMFHSFWKVEITPTASSFSMFCSSLLILITSNILRFFNLDYSEKNTTKGYAFKNINLQGGLNRKLTVENLDGFTGKEDSVNNNNNKKNFRKNKKFKIIDGNRKYDILTTDRQDQVNDD